MTEPDSDTKSGLQWQRAKLKNEHRWSDGWGVENSQVPGFGIPLSGFINNAGNELLNTNICTDEVTWNDLKGDDVGRIVLAGGVGACSGYLGDKFGGQISDKVINKFDIKSVFMKNAIEKTSQGFVGGYSGGFFNELMLGSHNVKEAFKCGFVEAGYGAASGFVFSSIEYSLNKNGVKEYWREKELRIKVKSQNSDNYDYYEYNFKYKYEQPNSMYYKFNPNINQYNYPSINWNVPTRYPISTPSNPLNIR